MADYIIEAHEELTGVGERTHAEIDAALDALQAGSWEHFAFDLTSSHLANEVQPAIVRVPLPSGKTMTGAKIIFGSMDGRQTISGEAWEPAPGGAAVDIYVPVDPDMRNRYLDAPVSYSFSWML